MEQVEKKIDPVLKPLRDRVLFLKHNLNARALGALTKELAAVSHDVDVLIVDMQQAIGEADAYLKAMAATRDTGIATSREALRGIPCDSSALSRVT